MKYRTDVYAQLTDEQTAILRQKFTELVQTSELVDLKPGPKEDRLIESIADVADVLCRVGIKSKAQIDALYDVAREFEWHAETDEEREWENSLPLFHRALVKLGRHALAQQDAANALVPDQAAQ